MKSLSPREATNFLRHRKYIQPVVIGALDLIPLRAHWSSQQPSSRAKLRVSLRRRRADGADCRPGRLVAVVSVARPRPRLLDTHGRQRRETSRRETSRRAAPQLSPPRRERRATSDAKSKHQGGFVSCVCPRPLARAGLRFQHPDETTGRRTIGRPSLRVHRILQQAEAQAQAQAQARARSTSTSCICSSSNNTMH